MTSGTTLDTAADTAAGVLTFARDRRRAADTAEAELLQAAVAWANLHPVESIHHAALLTRFEDAPFAVAGPGAPLVSEFCVAEFAAAVGLPTDYGKEYLGEAVELAYRLPRTWARVKAGDLAAWRARRIARETLGLTVEAAGFVDDNVAKFAHRVRPTEVDRLVADAAARHMPTHAEQTRERGADGRHVTIQHTQVSYLGTSYLHGELDLADALDLETAIAHGAAVLAACGSVEALDVRRSQALGEIARRQTTLDLTPTDAPEQVPARQTVLHVHISPDSPFARVETSGRRVVTRTQVDEWLTTTATQVVIQPIIDLTEHLHVSAYEVPDRFAAQAQERDHRRVLASDATPSLRSCDEEVHQTRSAA